MVLICTIIITIIRVAKVRLGASTMVLGCTRTLSTAGRDIWSVFLSTYIRIYWTAAGIGCLAVFFLVLKLGVPVKKDTLYDILTFPLYLFF